MPSLTVQLHATPEELITFADRSAAEFNLFFTVMRYWPDFELIVGTPDDNVGDVVEKVAVVDRIALLQSAPVVPAESPFDFTLQNPESLDVDVEHVKENTLPQTAVTASSNNRSRFKLWQKLARRLKRQTNTGAWIIIELNGTRHFCPHERYTDGARRLALSGTKMVNPAGGNYYEFAGDHNYYIATPYDDRSRGNWGAKFKKLFASSDQCIQGKSNRIHLSGHQGPYNETYHEAVYDKLGSAVFGKKGPARGDALEDALEDIANQLLRDPTILNTGSLL